jgi:hypothetical protein
MVPVAADTRKVDLLSGRFESPALALDKTGQTQDYHKH